MTWTKQLDELIHRLVAAIPPGVQEIPSDLEKNFRSIIQSAFNRMDLVTREEFDVQVAVLRRTREKLELLAKELQERKTT